MMMISIQVSISVGLPIIRTHFEINTQYQVQQKLIQCVKKHKNHKLAHSMVQQSIQLGIVAQRAVNINNLKLLNHILTI